MKKLVLICAFTPLFAFAQARFDGNWWAALDEPGRLYYSIGYLNGAAHAAVILPASICLHQKYVGTDLEKCLVSANEAAHDAFVKPMLGKPYGQFISGITAFYQDYRNKSICFKAAARIVQAEVNGMKHEKVTEWVESVRALPTTGSCD